MKRVLLTVLAMGVVAAPGRAAERKPYTRNVAIVVYENAEPLDWTGPFEVYNDAARSARVNGQPAFNVYIVSKTAEPVNSQGLTVVPSYSIANAPKPDIVVFPGGPAAKIYDDPAFFAWARQAAEQAEVAQSVCTGAFVLGQAGLLDGLEATTHYGAIEGLKRAYPKATVENGRRFVDNGHVVTTAGISAGIDGSLHVVARLLGRRVADDVAAFMEYHWTPDAFLARDYAYLNPSSDARGRELQTGEMKLQEKDYAGAEASFRAVLAADPDNREAWSDLGAVLRETKQHAGAGEALARAVEGSSEPYAAYGYYEAAVQYALAQLDDQAVEMLGKAFAAGYSNREAVEREPALARLKGDPRLKRLIASR
jgi:putative intracellular protease/amidase